MKEYLGLRPYESHTTASWCWYHQASRDLFLAVGGERTSANVSDVLHRCLQSSKMVMGQLERNGAGDCGSDLRLIAGRHASRGDLTPHGMRQSWQSETVSDQEQYEGVQCSNGVATLSTRSSTLCCRYMLDSARNLHLVLPRPGSRHWADVSRSRHIIISDQQPLLDQMTCGALICCCSGSRYLQCMHHCFPNDPCALPPLGLLRRRHCQGQQWPG